jgi:hypothetical protein
MKKTGINLNPGNPICPCCNEKMGLNCEEEGIYIKDAILNIPIICPKCKFELWIQAFPINVICDAKFMPQLLKQEAGND